MEEALAYISWKYPCANPTAGFRRQVRLACRAMSLGMFIVFVGGFTVVVYLDTQVLFMFVAISL